MIQQCQGCHIVNDCGPEAPWLIFVHGVSQDHRIFDKQVSAFRDKYRILLIDLPGHGSSSGMLGPYGVAELANHIEECARATGVARAVLWGTHLGATAGLWLACRRTDLFRAQVLEAPPFPGRLLPSVSDLISRVAQQAKKNGLQAARDLWWIEGPWFETIRQAPERCRAATHRQIINEFQGRPWLDSGLVSSSLGDVEAALRKLQTPIVLVNGQYDVPDFVEAAEALTETIPNCSRITVPDGGGFPSWEYPDETNSMVGDVLNAVSAS